MWGQIQFGTAMWGAGTAVIHVVAHADRLFKVPQENRFEPVPAEDRFTDTSEPKGDE